MLDNNLFDVYSQYPYFSNVFDSFFLFNSGYSNSKTLTNVYWYVSYLLVFFVMYLSIGSKYSNIFVLDDQNIGPSHDIIFFIIFNMVFLGYNLFFSADLLSSTYLYIRFFNFVFITLYLFILIFCLGFYIVLYIKGSAQSKFFFYTMFIDFIQLNSFLIRVTIQFVRIVMLYGTLYVFYLGWSELTCYSEFNPGSLQILTLTLTTIRALFEVVHSLFVVLMQTALFMFLLV